MATLPLGRGTTLGADHEGLLPMRRMLLVLFGSAAVLLAALRTATYGEVRRLSVEREDVYANGKSFGDVGRYRRLRGWVEFALDPGLPVNRSIVDLSLAPRQKDGKVHFRAQFDLLVPERLDRANGVLLYEVNNRGNRLALGMFNGGNPDFLFRHGYILLWSGWIAEVLPGNDRLLLEAPVARGKDGPIRGLVRQEFVSDTERKRMQVTHWANMGAYRPTTTGLAWATLTWRLRERDPRVLIPRNQWRLHVREIEQDGFRSVLPLVEIEVSGGIQPGYIYELIYEAQDPVVQGVGLAGIRDLVSMLRNENRPDNPLWDKKLGRSAVRATLAFGASQSGRLLRFFLYDGFNEDESGRRVFDGMFIHIAGAGLGFFNHRFASPTRHAGQHDNHSFPVDIFPFSYAFQVDPFSGERDSILRRAIERNVVPKIFHVQTSAEYWHRSGSLVHTDPLGKRDLALPENVRIYALGGAQHGPGNGRPPAAWKRGTLRRNPTDYRPICRALLRALTDWVLDQRDPPASVYPTLREGTLTGWRQHQSGWRPLPGVRYPEVIQQPEAWDFGPRFRTERIITIHPPRSRGTYTVLVPRYGPDNNELGMLDMPSVAVPVATYTGWNLRHRSIGAENELLSLTGGYIPLPATEQERRRRGDPRPSLESLYPGGFEEYLKRYERVAGELIRRRYCLEEDRRRLMEIAEGVRPLFESREPEESR